MMPDITFTALQVAIARHIGRAATPAEISRSVRQAMDLEGVLEKYVTDDLIDLSKSRRKCECCGNYVNTIIEWGLHNVGKVVAAIAVEQRKRERSSKSR